MVWEHLEYYVPHTTTNTLRVIYMFNKTFDVYTIQVPDLVSYPELSSPSALLLACEVGYLTATVVLYDPAYGRVETFYPKLCSSKGQPHLSKRVAAEMMYRRHPNFKESSKILKKEIEELSPTTLEELATSLSKITGFPVEWWKPVNVLTKL